LSLQVTNAPPNAYLAVARVFQQDGVYGLEPVERLVSDSQGRLSSLETNATDRLPGITGAGQYVLLQLDQPQTLVKGIARNALAQPAGGLLVRLGPWTTMSRVPDGAFLLIAPAGTNQLVLTDLSIAPGQAIANPFLTAGSVGPRVVSITPTNAATGVPLVTAINIIFSKPLNPGTLLGNGAQLLGASNQIIVTSLSLNLANTTASLLPAATLDAATTYTVVLATNILDASGRPLEGDLQFTFTTVGLSARDSAAQLIIYQPGATNVPTNVVAQIPGYVPGADPDTIVVQGSPGVADPRVAVVLANESSGETSTVLSKADGSFVSVIRGAEEDFVSATFINLNGTRVYVPVSRQLFDNGFVGLYRQGGILEAESDGGPVQVFIQPEAVQSRAKFRIQTLSADALSQELGGVAPESGTVAANAVKMEVSGEQPSGPVKVSFPVNLTAIGFPTNLAPQDAALALTIAQDVDGV
jgi:hypothetical protein